MNLHDYKNANTRQEYWSGLPLPSSGDLSDPGDQTCNSCIDRQVLYSEPQGEPTNPLACLKFLMISTHFSLPLYIIPPSSLLSHIFCYSETNSNFSFWNLCVYSNLQCGQLDLNCVLFLSFRWQKSNYTSRSEIILWKIFQSRWINSYFFIFSFRKTMPWIIWYDMC